MQASDVVSGVLGQSFQSRQNAESVMRALGIDHRLLTVTAPTDDGVPPNGVTGLTATPFVGALQLKWDRPPPEDGVRKSKVEITPDGDPLAIHEFNTVSEAVIYDLEYKEHTIRVMLIDEWGRESAWSGTVTATPKQTADTAIDLEYALAQGNLQGLIEAINVAGPTAEEGIKANSLAATLESNMLPVIESDLEMWDTSTWPPPDAEMANGTRIISAQTDTGHTLSVEVQQGQRKLKHVRAITVNNYAIPVTQWRNERYAVTGQSYIASAYVQGLAGTQVEVQVQQASDLSGTGLALAASKTVTLAAGTQRIAVVFQGSATKPYVRLRLGLLTDNQTVYWNKFMLERARTGATEASPWNAGVLATGSISARALTVMTANIADAVIDTAAIQEAHIGSVNADAIVTGTLQASESISVAGEIIAGGAVMDSHGLYLVQQAISPDGTAAYPSATDNDWLSSPPDVGIAPTPHSGIGFFDDTDAPGRVDDPKRGILIHSRGIEDGNRDGYISIAATSGPADRTRDTSAFVILRAAKPGIAGEVVIGHRLTVNGNINGNLHVDNLFGGTINAGLLPEAALSKKVKWANVTGKPNLVTSNELQGYAKEADVRRIVKDMVSDKALNG